MLPERSAEDILTGRIRLTFGTGTDLREVVLPVLPINPNRDFIAALEKKGMQVFEAFEGVDTKQVFAWLAGLTDEQIELLTAYDQQHVLPDAEWLADHATNYQVLSAFLGVCAAAHPLAAGVIDAMSESDRDQAISTMIASGLMSAFAPPTNTAPRSTAGRRKKSARR